MLREANFVTINTFIMDILSIEIRIRLRLKFLQLKCMLGMLIWAEVSN